MVPGMTGWARTFPANRAASRVRVVGWGQGSRGFVGLAGLALAGFVSRCCVRSWPAVLPSIYYIFHSRLLLLLCPLLACCPSLCISI